jgi:SAM-dependent methyltransferase
MALFTRRRPDQVRPDPVRPELDPRSLKVSAQEELERHYEQFPSRTPRIGEHMKGLLADAGVAGGRILEIGGRGNPYSEWFPGFEYVCLDLTETGPGVMLGDITKCPEIESESFDVILSVDVFEHIQEPWLAAPEIVRLLRPGGFTYHSTLFSWRYHPCPVDFWRYTPDALNFLFRDLDRLASDFDTTERRRNLIGRDENRIKPDAFGGWRENWRVFYAGTKPTTPS